MDKKCIPNDVIKVAKSQIGYLEKKSNSLLDFFTENVGNKNYTKYAMDFKKFTGFNYQGQPWCDMFVDWCFVEAFGIDKAKELLGGFSAYTPTSANLFKAMNRWYDSNPKVGDIIFFRNSERINHTGIVINVSNTKVYTIEGNTSSGAEVIENGGGVFRKEYLLSNSKIAGYGRPEYTLDDWIARLQNCIGAKVDNIAGKETLSKTPTIKYGSKGEVVKLVQERLQNKYNINIGKYGADGSCGNDTVKAINTFQKKFVGISKPDGELTSGQMSWKTMLGL